MMTTQNPCPSCGAELFIGESNFALCEICGYEDVIREVDEDDVSMDFTNERWHYISRPCPECGGRLQERVNYEGIGHVELACDDCEFSDDYDE